MKVLWFTLTPCGASEILNTGSQGGGWLSALEKHLTASGEVDIHICFLWDTNIPSFSHGDTTYHPIQRLRIKKKLFGYILNGFFIKNPIQSYAEVISCVKPDLIHVHGTEEDFGMIQSVTDIPVIISIQGLLTNYICKYFSGISFSRLVFKENIFEHLKLKSVLANYLIFLENAKRERIILSMAKHVIGRTTWDFRSTAVLAPNAIYHHGDEIIRDSFYSGVWSRECFSSPLRIVTVSSIAPYKGFETILNVSCILNTHIGMNFEWTVIGLSPNDTLIKVMHDWLGEQKNIKLLGIRSENDIHNILLSSDVYCQVSHIENSPNSLCEAMLIGMPIIASFAGGTDSILSAGVEGILVQDGDPWSMAGAILELYRDFNKAANMGKAAKTRAQVRHNPKRIVNELLATYKLVMEQDTSMKDDL